MKFFLINCLLIVMLSGCATDIANRYYLSEKYPAKAFTDVEILYEKPSRKFIVMADFQSRGETAEDMREKAADIGADAVIVSHLGGYYSVNEQWASKDRQKGSYTRIVATAIKYTEEN